MDVSTLRAAVERNYFLPLHQLYPHVFDENLSDYARCAEPDNKLYAVEAFKKYCPSKYQVEEVYIGQRNKQPACNWVVLYQLKNEDGQDDVPLLPTGPGLQQLFQDITKISPLDVQVIEKGVITPDTAAVKYVVNNCSCKPQFFECTASRPHGWHLEEAFIQDFENCHLKA